MAGSARLQTLLEIALQVARADLGADRVVHESVDDHLKRLDPVGSHYIDLANEQGFESNGQVDEPEADRFGDLFTVQYWDQLSDGVATERSRSEAGKRATNSPTS